MYAVEFEATVHDGLIEIPAELRTTVSDQVRVILLVREPRTGKKNWIEHWDSLIVSSALAGGCKVLYSEDMQHKLIIKRRLTVLNPFL